MGTVCLSNKYMNKHLNNWFDKVEDKPENTSNNAIAKERKRQGYDTKSASAKIVANGMRTEAIKKQRLEELRAILQSETESLSYGELSELADLVEYIEPGYVELLEAAGVPEFHEDCKPDNKCRECLRK